MHTYVYCSTIHNSKDLEPTQMPICERLDREKVAHMHHGILCSHKKWWVHVLRSDIDEAGNHHSQQTDTRTQNQTPYALTHRQVLNNENTWTQGGEYHSLWSVVGGRGGTVGVGRVGSDNEGRNTRYRWWGMKAANRLAMYVPMQQSCMICMCTPEPKVQLRKNRIRPSELEFLGVGPSISKL